VREPAHRPIVARDDHPQCSDAGLFRPSPGGCEQVRANTLPAPVRGYRERRLGDPVAAEHFNQLIDAAWSGLVVEESNLTVQIAALRRVLGVEPGGDKWIETLPRRGYRFVGPVTKGVPATVVDVPGSAPASASIATAHPEAVEHGPSVLAYFGYPAAHEDDAEQAVRAGLRLCTAVENLASNENVQLRRRVGIATGLVIAGERAELGDAGARAVVGQAPSVAERLQALGQPGTVTIDGTTRRLIGDIFQCRDLATATVDAETDEAFQVLGSGQAPFRRAAWLSTDTVCRSR